MTRNSAVITNHNVDDRIASPVVQLNSPDGLGTGPESESFDCCLVGDSDLMSPSGCNPISSGLLLIKIRSGMASNIEYAPNNLYAVLQLDHNAMRAIS